MGREYQEIRDDRTAEEIVFGQFFDALGDSIDTHVADVPRSLQPGEKFSGTRKDAADHEWTHYLLEIPNATTDAMVAFVDKHRWKRFLSYVRSVDAFPLPFEELAASYLAKKSGRATPA